MTPFKFLNNFFPCENLHETFPTIYFQCNMYFQSKLGFPTVAVQAPPSFFNEVFN
jgi:hypothetical protein